jgi:indolepyruvate decarboxylase
VRVERASDLPAAVDEALTIARTQQRPVYVEIAKHLWWADCPSPTGPLPMPSWPDGAAVTLADQVGQRLATAERPVVLVGCQVARLGLHDAVEQLLDRAAVPWVSTMLGKGVLDEQRAGFAGVYAGKRSVPDVRSLVEQADLVVAIGAVMGRQYRTLATAMGDRLVRADLQGVRIGDAAVQPASLPRWVEALTSAVSEGAHDAWRTAASLSQKRFEQRRASVPERDEPAAVGREPGMRYDEVLSCVSEACSHDVLLMSDTSLSMYPAAEANLKGRGAMLCNAVWAAIGYSAGACVGAALGQGRRPLVVCGDGGFQMTSEALSALARYRLNAVVLVLDNAVYGIEQWLLDPSWHRDADRPPRDYLGLAAWDYVGLAKAMGVSGVAVGDVGGLRTALSDALAADGPRLIAVKVKPHDLPRELRA